MKRTLPILAVLAFLAFLAAPTSAQPRPRDVWVGGITLGPNYSKLSGSYIESSDWLQNPMVGGWFEYRDHDNFSVALEFNWLRKGGKNIITTAGDTLSTLEVGSPRAQPGARCARMPAEPSGAFLSGAASRTTCRNRGARSSSTSGIRWGSTGSSRTVT